MQLANVLLFLLSIMHTIQLVASYDELIQNLQTSLKKELWINKLIENKDQIQGIKLLIDNRSSNQLFGPARYNSNRLNKDGQHDQEVIFDTWTTLPSLVNTKIEKPFFIMFNVHNLAQSLRQTDYRLYPQFIVKIPTLIYAFSFTFHYLSQNQNTSDEALKTVFDKYFYLCKEINERDFEYEFFHRYLQGTAQNRCRLPDPDQLADDYNIFIWTERVTTLGDFFNHFQTSFATLYISPFCACYVMSQFFENQTALYFYNKFTLSSALITMFCCISLTNNKVTNHFKFKRYISFDPATNELKKTIFSGNLNDWKLRTEDPNFDNYYYVPDENESALELVLIYSAWTTVICIGLQSFDYTYRSYLVLQKHKNEI